MKMCIVSRIRLGCVIAAIPTVVMASDVTVQQVATSRYAQETGASERVDYSGKLRMLSQRVVAASCNFSAGIAPEISGADMRAAHSEFNLIVDALENGNPDLGIHGVEKRKKTRLRIGMLNDAWLPVANGLDAVRTDPNTAENLVSVAELSAPLLESAANLAGEISAQYSNPATLILANAMLIDLSGKQRMLIQRISKNVCLVASNINAEASKAELSATVQLFEASLTALLIGNPAAGINSPPNVQIAEGLNLVIEEWVALRPYVNELLANDTLTPEDRAFVFHGMNQMTADMNKVVGLYSQASKHGGMADF